MPIILQEDASIYSLFTSVNRCTCFGWCLHPSSGDRVTVSTAFGISKTATATAAAVQSRSGQVAVAVSLMSDAVDTVTRAPDDGWRHRPKHVERFTDVNKLYIVTSCLKIIDWIWYLCYFPASAQSTVGDEANCVQHDPNGVFY